MKINELIGYKNKPEYQAFASEPSNPKDLSSWEREEADIDKLRSIVAKLNQLGYRQYSIGEGFYGRVYARPQDNYVIKIFRQDRGYTRFLQYIRENRTNPYVPKLRGKIIKLPNNFNLVRIEKLETIPYELWGEILFAANKPDDQNRTKDIDQRYPGLLAFIAELKEMVKYSGKTLHFDLHRNNMMMRGDTPVIIDPFSDPAED